MAADVVGYSSLMGEDEAGTLSALRSMRTDLLVPAVSAHRGTIVKSMGDGWLIAFDSAAEAVSCAVEWQEKLSEQAYLAVRMGLHIGDVTYADGDVYGDGVNIAARLQEIAEPGAIVISETAKRSIDGRLATDFNDLGRVELKNIAEPVTAFGWGMSAVAADAVTLPLPDKPSIAVLPFNNMSGDPEQEHFADGIAEDIITSLSKFHLFFVIARNSSFTYKGRPVDAKQVGQELGVRYILEGSVRKADNRIRITSQLIEAATGHQVWAERYDRELHDIFALQDEMTDTIVGALEPEIGAAERNRAKRKRPDSLDAWEFYQRGLWHLWRTTMSDYTEAERLFDSAIELDSGFAPAHASLSYLNFARVLFGWTDKPEDCLDNALRTGKQAVAADENDAFGHYALGRIHSMRGEFDAAIAELEKSLELNPNHVHAEFGLGFVHCWRGKPEEALPRFVKAIRQSPRDPAFWTFEGMMGFAHLQLGRYDAAVEWSKKSVRHPNSTVWPQLNLARSLVSLGQLDQARKALSDALKIQPNISAKTITMMFGAMHKAHRDSYIEALRQVGLPD